MSKTSAREEKDTRGRGNRRPLSKEGDLFHARRERSHPRSKKQIVNIKRGEKGEKDLEETYRKVPRRYSERAG